MRLQRQLGSCGVTVIALCLFFLPASITKAESQDAAVSFVGSKACSECHPREYESFSKLAKKAHSYDHILPLKSKLTESEFAECCSCHTLGYGKPGGFISADKTPEMRNLGCESCHGPGGRHIESEDRDDIIADVNIESCDACHSNERVAAFDYKPLLHGGAH